MSRETDNHLSPSLRQTSFNSFGFEEFIQEVTHEGLNMYAICVRQHNKVLGQFSWKDGRREDIRSCSKSVLSLALGIAIEEGYLALDEKIVDIFPELTPEKPSEYLQEITIRHLITMSPGYDGYILPGWLRDWQEDKDWVHYSLHYPVEFKPGERFIYNNASPIIVARAIQKRTGEVLLNWLKPRLFDPLGIPNPQWFTCPLGYTIGAGSLFLNTEEMTRIGQLCLNSGRWEGRRLVPEAYVREATSFQIATHGNMLYGGEDGSAGFGYFFWMTSMPGVFQSLGMYGQRIFCFRDLDAVVAVAGHLERDEMYQREFDVVKRTILPKLEANA